jgi:DNA (cytosine-5)-methyltransferase 1
MKVGSLFSGIGGLDLAIEAHGYQVAWQVENDDYCNKILAKHWPEVTRYGDIKSANFDEFERVDGVIGGFPCQPFSVAGHNRGEDDERNMWPEVIRAIRALRPGFAFLENVPGLLNHEYFGRILGDLAEAGYDAEWGTFRASDVGAPHRRERLFILADTNEQGLEGWDISPHSTGEWATRTSSPQPWPPSPNDHDGWAYLLSEMPEVEPALCRDADGIPDRAHRLKALGNAVVWPQAALAFSKLRDRL